MYLCISLLQVYSIICYFINLWMIFVFVILTVVGCYISVFVYRSQQVDSNFGQKQRSLNAYESEVWGQVTISTIAPISFLLVVGFI